MRDGVRYRDAVVLRGDDIDGHVQRRQITEHVEHRD